MLQKLADKNQGMKTNILKSPMIMGNDTPVNRNRRRLCLNMTVLT